MRVAVIGAGVVGLACAATLAQRGHLVRWIDPEPPGRGCSGGNAGLFSLSSFVPLALPGAWAKAPGWLTDSQGPLTIRPAYLPRALPWLWQLHRSSRIDRVVASADAMHSLLAPTWDAWLPLAQWAGASALIRRDGWAAAYRSRAALDGDALGWRLRAERGVRIDTLTGGSVCEFDPNLSPAITHLLHLPDQGHCLDPLALCQALARAVLAQSQSAHGGLGGLDGDHRARTNGGWDDGSGRLSWGGRVSATGTRSIESRPDWKPIFQLASQVIECAPERGTTTSGAGHFRARTGSTKLEFHRRGLRPICDASHGGGIGNLLDCGGSNRTSRRLAAHCDTPISDRSRRRGH
jgi:hypothetical protein